jgi:hypothetical protein
MIQKEPVIKCEKASNEQFSISTTVYICISVAGRKVLEILDEGSLSSPFIREESRARKNSEEIDFFNVNIHPYRESCEVPPH